MEKTSQTRSCVHENIHPCTKGEEDEVRTFWKERHLLRYIVSHMVIESEDKDSPNYYRIDPSSLVVHPSDYYEEPIGLVDIPRYVAVTKKRPSWLRNTL
jgi:hypothetical protein